jgi:hypothetical protein
VPELGTASILLNFYGYLFKKKIGFTWDLVSPRFYFATSSLSIWLRGNGPNALFAQGRTLQQDIEISGVTQGVGYAVLKLGPRACKNPYLRTAEFIVKAADS